MSENVDKLFDDEVTTGATLNSGTTIASNTTYHLGNDGSGSGLDAETVDGSEIVATGDTWNINPSGDKFTIDGGFSSPGGNSAGLDFESSGCVWVGNNYVFDDYDIFKTDQNGNIDVELVSPSGGPGSVALDSNECIWQPDNDAQKIYQLDQSATVISSFSRTVNYFNGIDIDSSGCVWNTDSTNGNIDKYNTNGSVQSSFNSPSDKPVGIHVDGSEVWISEGTADSVYETDTSGTVSQQVKSAIDGPDGNSKDSNGSLWIATSDCVYKTQQNDTTAASWQISSLQ